MKTSKNLSWFLGILLCGSLLGLYLLVTGPTEMPLTRPILESDISQSAPVEIDLISLEQLNLSPADPFGTLYFIAVAESLEDTTFESVIAQLHNFSYRHQILETIDHQGNKWLMLAVGEFIDIEEAQIAASQLNAQLNLTGTVKKFPPGTLPGELKQLRFMQLPEMEAMRCRNDVEHWQSSQLNEALTVYREYEAFIKQDENQTSLHTIAHRKVAGVIKYLLDNSQTADVPPIRLAGFNGPLQNREKGIAAKAQNFKTINATLLQNLNHIQQLKLAEVHADLKKCTQQYAIAALKDIDGLVDESQLYQIISESADPTLSFEFLLLLRQNGDLPQYLENQHARFGVIAQYAEPYVSFLLNTNKTDDNGVEEGITVNYWSSTLRVFSEYRHARNDENPVKFLDDYLLSVLANLDINNCGNTDFDVQPANGDDLFSATRRKWHTHVLAACGKL